MHHQPKMLNGPTELTCQTAPTDRFTYLASSISPDIARKANVGERRRSDASMLLARAMTAAVASIAPGATTLYSPVPVLQRPTGWSAIGPSRPKATKASNRRRKNSRWNAPEPNTAASMIAKLATETAENTSTGGMTRDCQGWVRKIAKGAAISIMPLSVSRKIAMPLARQSTPVGTSAPALRPQACQQRANR